MYKQEMVIGIICIFSFRKKGRLIQTQIYYIQYWTYLWFVRKSKHYDIYLIQSNILKKSIYTFECSNLLGCQFFLLQIYCHFIFYHIIFFHFIIFFCHPLACQTSYTFCYTIRKKALVTVVKCIQHRLWN